MEEASKSCQHATWLKKKNRKDVILEAPKEESSFATLKSAELQPKFLKNKGRVVLRGDIEKDFSGAYAVFAEQGSSASHMTAAHVMDVIARLHDCDGQAAAGLLWEGQFHKVFNGTWMACLFIENRDCCYRYTVDIKIDGKGAEYGSHVEETDGNVDFDEPISFHDHVYLGCTHRECKPNEIILDEDRKCSNHEFLLDNWKTQSGDKALATVV